MLAAAVVGAGTLFSAPAVACDEPVCEYRTVCIYETRTVPYYCTVTLYDECDQPYEVRVLRYKQVKVPVTKLVKVCY
jgi:hypothetical protein